MTAESLARHPLWHAVGLGMQPYARLAFRVETHGGAGLRFDPGLLIVVTHRAESDPPILIAELYRNAKVWLDRGQRLHFAARDDMFERGFFAGFPRRMPARVRRLLYPLEIGRYLPMVRVHPIGSAVRMKLGQALHRVDPRTPLPPVVAERFGSSRPRTAADALRGEFAVPLWEDVDRESFPVPEAWAHRAAEARAQFQTLVELMRAGEPLVIFPEGKPSPDGAVGPLQAGIRLLVRRGRPARISPWAIAYDPLVRGRTKAVVSLRPHVAPDLEHAEAQVLSELKLAMPVTCGSVVVHALRGGVDPAASLEAAVEAAPAEGRHVERALETEAGRHARLAECLEAINRKASEGLLERLAREYESAREP
jgi:1-acyl-sn-glycerol-3-phosphate acyltransferase